MAIATARADRVRGVVLGNRWFWPTDDLSTKAFSMVMSSPPIQWAILRRNERLISGATATPLRGAVMEYYRRVLFSPEARAGVVRMPKEILAARPLLERLARDVPDKLGSKPALLVWRMKDFAFRPGRTSPGCGRRSAITCSSSFPTPSTTSRRMRPRGSPMRSSTASAEPAPGKVAECATRAR
jgi:haloalkane dehalogenase